MPLYNNLVKLAHLLVELRQRCLGHKTRPVIHDFHQWLGKQLIIAFTIRQSGFCWTGVGSFRERRNVLRGGLVRCLRFVMLDEAPYWQSLFRVVAYSKVQVARRAEREQALAERAGQVLATLAQP